MILLTSHLSARWDFQAFLHRWAFEPVGEHAVDLGVRIEIDQMASVVILIDVAQPRQDGDVGDGVFIAHHPLLAAQMLVDDAQQTLALGHIAFQRAFVFKVFATVFVEEAHLSIIGPTPPTWKNSHCMHS